MQSLEPIKKVPPQAEPQKTEKSPIHPEIEKVAREPLGLPSPKAPSEEQGKILADFLVRANPPLVLESEPSIPLIEAERLYTVLSLGLLRFEKGESYLASSPSGELVRIENSDTNSFLNAYLHDAASLLQKAASSTQHKKAFYKVLGQLVQSTTFLSLYPNWKETLGKSFYPDQKTAEEAFLSNPSVEILSSLVTLYSKQPEPLAAAPAKLQYVAQSALSRPIEPHINFLNKGIAKISKLIKMIIAIYSSLFISETLLTMAHARFHRTSIDGKMHKESFPILDGGTPSMSFSHFINSDWKPARALFEADNKALDTKTKQKLEETEKILKRSRIFFRTIFDFSPSIIKEKLITRKINRLKDHAKLVFPGGMKDHAILYEVEKRGEGALVRVYNTGFGAATVGSKFIVQEYSLEKKEIDSCIHTLLSFAHLSQHKIAQQFGLSEDSPSLLNEAIEKIMPHPWKIYSLHHLQDRGNCFWKSFSSWMNTQLKGCTVTVTKSMVEAAKKKAPYAAADLDLLANTHAKIPLSRFLHRIGYEKVRTEFAKLFSKHKPNPFPILKQKKIRFYSFVKYYSCLEKTKNTKTEADQYISSLVRGIISEPASARYQRKGLRRRWRALL